MPAKTLKSITLRLATADEIRRMSGGEVTSDATVDESGAPVPGGLFCQRIFGEDGRRFGHIELACSVVHPWYEDLPDAPVLEALPVVPPVMRPLVPGPGGAALSSDLNELYRRVISRNGALKELPAKGAYAADARERLIDAVRSLISGDGALQSLTDLLAGENGLLKRNLAGKRQDYSGRSVIVSGPDLKMSQCGLPYEMALAQFKPFIARKLVELGLAADSSQALDKIDTDHRGPGVRKAANLVVSERLVLLNRAPTLHRLGIQPFEPVLVDHRSIALHPLVCYGFNADFDGDQMAVHVPVSGNALAEARELLDSAINLASPANGKPIAGPVQDIALGLWYLTHESGIGNWELGNAPSTAKEILSAVESGDLHAHAPVVLKDRGFSGESELETTAGRVTFNAALPRELRFVNEQVTRSRLTELVARCLEMCGHAPTREILDDLNKLGFEHATRYAPSYGLGVTPDDGPIEAIRSRTLAREHEMRSAGAAAGGRGSRRAGAHDEVRALWSEAAAEAREAVQADLAARDGGLNPIHALIESGARGNRANLAQTFGIAGPLWGDRPDLEAAVASNFWNGLRPLELFARSFAARKGLIDTSVRWFEAAALMRELIFAGQGVLVTSEDCGTNDGLEVAPITHDGALMEGLAQRIQGRVAAEDVKDSSGAAMVQRGELISKEKAGAVEAAGIEKVRIRSALTCAADRGVCAKCYGDDPAWGRMVKLGTAVGVIAAQAMAEPAVQLTFRTFYPAADPPKPDAPRHPGGLQQMIELLQGGSPELTPVELIERCQCMLRYQGVDVNDKHFELIARVMYSFTRVDDPGDTGLAEGEIVANEALKRANAAAQETGGRPAKGSPAMLGALAAAQHSTSVIGSAAVGDARRILARAALKGATDAFENRLERIVAGLA